MNIPQLYSVPPRTLNPSWKIVKISLTLEMPSLLLFFFPSLLATIYHKIIFDNHLNPVKLVFIEKLLLSTVE